MFSNRFHIRSFFSKSNSNPGATDIIVEIKGRDYVLIVLSHNDIPSK